MLNPLRLKRLELGVTQMALSFKCNVPSTYISLYERGYPILKTVHKERIAKALGVNVQELFPEKAG